MTILSASPRKSGNCDTAAQICKSGLEDAGAIVSLLYLRDFEVKPCVSCGACRENNTRLPDPDAGQGENFACPLGQTDDVPKLLGSLSAADRILVISPIYFYHLPASFKALLDRMQSLWRDDAHPADAPTDPSTTPCTKPCGVILIAGRKTGDKLFEGSLLTLKYSLANLSVFMEDPLLLRGLDGPKDLDNSPECQRLIDAYAKTAAFC